MKTAKILTILVLALGLIVCQAKVSEAAPLGTAFTYQGHLYDNNDVANGLYDLQFSLYDVNVGGAAVANDVNVHDMDVIDGFFTVELDFGSEVFDGNARWLEIGIRPGDQNDPNVYTALSPRQEVTPVPYALQTRGIFVDSTGNIGLGTTSPTRKLDIADGYIRLRAGGIYFDQNYSIYWYGVSSIGSGPSLDLKSTGGISFRPDGGNLRVRFEPAGEVGIGANPPTAKLHIVQPGTGDVFRVDDTYIGDSSPFLIDDTGNVGIGTTSPARKLHVSDAMRLEPGSAPSSPSEGDMYMDGTTHTLMVYDGTTWQACW
jgi:hypothetical protein